MMISLIQDFDNEMKQQALHSCIQYCFSHSASVGELTEDLGTTYDLLHILMHLRVEQAAKHLRSTWNVLEKAQMDVDGKKKVGNEQQKYQDALVAFLNHRATPQMVRMCRVLTTESPLSLTSINSRRQVKSKQKPLNRRRLPMLSRR